VSNVITLSAIEPSVKLFSVECDLSSVVQCRCLGLCLHIAHVSDDANAEKIVTFDTSGDWK